MGWGSGTSLFYDVICTLQVEITDATLRQRIYVKLIRAFMGHDWDNMQECMDYDPAYDAALREVEPEWFEDDGERKQ